MTACPETPDLLDHLEGRLDLSPHVRGCETCTTALSELRSVLSAEAAHVTVTQLEVERALLAVTSRAKAEKKGRWHATFFVSAAAAAALFFLLPSVPRGQADNTGPEGTPGNVGVATHVPNVDVNPRTISDPRVHEIVSASTTATTAPISS